MDSAGKRVTRKPERLIDTLAQELGFIMSNVTTSNTMLTPTIITKTNAGTSNVTVTPSDNPKPQQSSSSDSKIQRMLAQLISDNSVFRESQEAFQRQTTEQLSQLVQQWQTTDIRLTKLEEES